MAPVYFEPESTASSVISASHTLPLLAAGTLPARGVAPSLTILRASTGGDSEPGIFTALDCFSSPSAFRSISWSAASSATSAAGFVAGGLDNGMVALWDSKRVRDRLGDKGELTVPIAYHEDYFSNQIRAPAPGTPQQHPAAEEEEDDLLFGFQDALAEMYEEEGRALNYENQAWVPPFMSQMRDNTVRTKLPATNGDAVALFQHHNKAAVHGLSFNHVEPHLLASGAGDRLVIWDVSYTRTSSVGSWEYVPSSPRKITCISWSASRDEFGCGSHEGDITFFDIRSNVPSTRLNQLNRCCSAIQFSPSNEHKLVISFGDLSEDYSVWSLDSRKPGECLWKLCDHSKGTHSLSWSSMEDLILAGTNDSKINILSTDDPKIISQMTGKHMFGSQMEQQCQRLILRFI